MVLDEKNKTLAVLIPLTAPQWDCKQLVLHCNGKRWTMKLHRYRHEDEVSYALGMTLTMEMLLTIPQHTKQIFISESIEEGEAFRRLQELCKAKSIPIETNEKAFNILSPKGNCFVIGVFRKFQSNLNVGSHIVLVNPSDAGNIGTIIRTALGFGMPSISLICPAVDIFDPKVVRASMGAIFHSQFNYYNSFEEYCDKFATQNHYAFMLQSSVPIGEVNFLKPYSLIFGNEATGLPDSYADSCQAIVIPHAKTIDSLNLPIAAGIAMFVATN